MGFSPFEALRGAAHSIRVAVERALPGLALRFRLRHRVPGQFQTYSYTLPDRYPWLFGFAREQLGNRDGLRILSFGCSSGEEVFALHRYLPGALIKGIDINPRNIAKCLEREGSEVSTHLQFVAAGTTKDETTNSYDAIFCLGVLCLGDLTALRWRRCDPFLRFEDFERAVADFARCLRPGGLLFLHGSNFRFSDTATSKAFDLVLEADASQEDNNVKFDRNDRLLEGERYRAAAFRKAFCST